jgi:hypothetical protein
VTTASHLPMGEGVNDMKQIKIEVRRLERLEATLNPLSCETCTPRN